jgi:hypothetical protein
MAAGGGQSFLSLRSGGLLVLGVVRCGYGTWVMLLAGCPRALLRVAMCRG